MSGSYAVTPNFALKKPVTGADDDLWGTHWNQNADTLDATLQSLTNGLTGGPFLPIVGGALAGPGNLTVGGLLAVTGASSLNGGASTTNLQASGTVSSNTNQSTFYGNNNGAFTYTFAGATQSNPVRLVGVFNGTNSSGSGHGFSFAIPNDQIASSSGALFSGFHMSHNMGGGPAAGGKVAGMFSSNHVGDIDSTTTSVFLGTLNAWFSGSAAIIGPNGGGGVAFNPQAFLNNTASGYKLLETIEGTVGSAVPILSRGFLGAFSGAGFAGSLNDYCFGVFSATGTPKQGFGMALTLGRSEAPWGMSATGSIIGTVVQTNGGGNGAIPQVTGFAVNLPTVNFGTAAWWTPGFQILGEGTHRIGGGVVAPVATGISIDVVNFVGGTATVSAPGLNYAVGDQIYDDHGGILNVDTIGVSGLITAFHYSRVPYSYGGAGPATMALRGGSGNQAAVAGVTWTQQRALQIQPTAGGLIGFNGSPPVVKPTITGSKGANAALASLLTALANYGLVTDSST